MKPQPTHAMLNEAVAVLHDILANQGFEAANEYYKSHVFPVLREDFKNRYQNTIETGRYAGLVTLVGTSPEPLILMIDTLPAENHLFLYTPETRQDLDVVLTACPGMANIQTAVIEETDPAKLYDALANFCSLAKPHGRIAFHITGGTKPMVAAAAMAGAHLDVDLFCIGHRSFSRHLRRPEPGTEYLFRLPTPAEVMSKRGD